MMQNRQETKIKIDDGYQINNNQGNLLKDRYYSNLAWMDRFSKSYNQLTTANKAIIYLSLSSGLIISVITLNIILVALFSLCLIWLATLNTHYQMLKERLDVILEDLSLSEMQLNQAVSANLKLQAKLEEAFEHNTKVFQDLVEAREEIEKITAQAKLKDQEIEEVRGHIEVSSQKIILLTSSLLEQKRLFTEKIAGFSLFLEHKRLSIEADSTACQQANPS